MPKHLVVFLITLVSIVLIIPGVFIFKYFTQVQAISGSGTVYVDSNSNNKSQEPEATSSATMTENSEKTFSKEELAKYNGKDGNPCYIALYGIVYDLTGMKGWTSGGHGHGIFSGKDLTALFEKHAPKSHRDPEFLKKFKVVGKYIGEPNPDTTIKNPH